MFEHLDDPVPPDGAARFDAVVHTARVRRRRRWAYAGSSGVVAAIAVLVSLLVIAPSHGQPSSLLVDEPSPSPSTSATSPQAQPTTASPSPAVTSPPATQGAPAPVPSLSPDRTPACPHPAYPADCGRAYWDDGPAMLPPASNGTYPEYEKCEQVGPAGTPDKPVPGLQIAASNFDPASMPAGGMRGGLFSFTNTSSHPVYVRFDYGWSIVDHNGNGLSANVLTYSGAPGEPGGIGLMPLNPGEQQQQASAGDAATSLVAYGCGDRYADRFRPLPPGDYEAVAWVGWYLYADAAAVNSGHVQASGVAFTDPVPVTVTSASPSASPSDSPSPSPSPTGSTP